MKRILFIAVISILGLLVTQNLMAQEELNQQTNKNTALIIIDIQNFYFPGGSMPLYEPEKAAEKAKELLTAFRNNHMMVIHVRHNARSGSDIYKSVTPIEGEKIISKDKANAFVGTDLLDYLKDNDIKNLVLCGMQTHMCLEATTRAASDLGFYCTVIDDACTTRDLTYDDHVIKAMDVHYSTLSTLKGTYAKIMTTEDYIKSLK